MNGAGNTTSCGTLIELGGGLVKMYMTEVWIGLFREIFLVETLRSGVSTHAWTGLMSYVYVHSYLVDCYII